MDILEFYTSVLGSVGARDVDGEGLLSVIYAGEEGSVAIGNKRLCLPTAQILREGNWEHRIAFHPLCEKINRTESPVLKLLKDVIGVRIDSIEKTLIKSLMHTAVSPALHKGIGGPKPAAYLRLLPDVTEKTYKVLCKILDQIAKPEYRLVNFYLKFGGDLELNASRTCVVSFPIYDDLDDTENKTVFGVPCDLKEKKKIKALLDYVFGDETVRATYSYGSSNPEAPFFHALLNSYAKVAAQINKLTEIHSKRLKEDVADFDIMTIDLDWVPELENFNQFRGMVPSLEGNAGGAEVAKESVASAVPARAYTRPAPTDRVEEEPRRTNRPVPGRGESSDSSDDPLSSFRNQFQKPQEESRSSVWGGRKETTRDNGWSRGGRDDRDDRSGRGSYRDDRGGRDRSGRGGGGRGGSFI
jgi:hypothetical protein